MALKGGCLGSPKMAQSFLYVMPLNVFFLLTILFMWALYSDCALPLLQNLSCAANWH